MAGVAESSWDVIDLDGAAIISRLRFLADSAWDSQAWDASEPLLRGLVGSSHQAAAIPPCSAAQSADVRRFAPRHLLRMELACVYRRWRSR